MKKKQLHQYKEQMKQFADIEGKYSIYKHPAIDYLILMMLDSPVPTKQDKFIPIKAYRKNDDGSETLITDMYQKSEDNDTIKRFTENVREEALKTFDEEKRIKRPERVEVIINVTTLERRYNEVDVDNLAKCVLDALNGIAFDDDSQVSTLIAQKTTHPMKVDSLMIFITKLTATRRGIFGDPALYSFKQWDT